MKQAIKKVMLVNIYDGLYGGKWVGLAPHILSAYAEQFDVSKEFQIVTKQFGQKDSVESVVRSINNERPDAVGFSLYVYNARKNLNVISNLEDCLVLLGGPYVTDIERDLLNDNPNVDIVVTGEGEQKFRGLLEHFAGVKSLEDIPGITTRDFQTERTGELVDLNTVPSVYDRIFKENPKVENICIETSRGCPYKCKYCSWSFAKNIRYYDLDFVLKNLEKICTNKGVKNVYFTDSCLFANKDRAKTILKHLIKLKSKQVFSYELYLEHVDSEIMDLIAQLPNHDFSFGLQTVNPSANTEIGRRLNPEKFRLKFQEMASKLSNAHLSIDLMYPLPGDTLEGFKKSIDFAMSLDNVSHIEFNPLILLPGSQFFKDPEKYGLKLRDSKSFLVEESSSFSKADLKKAVRYQNYTHVIQANRKLHKCILLLAQKNNAGIMDTIIEFIDGLPFDVFDGEELQEMLTPEWTDENYFYVMSAMMFNYSKIIKYFKIHTNHEYDDVLRGWRSSFNTMERIDKWLITKVVFRRLLKRTTGIHRKATDKRENESISAT